MAALEYGGQAVHFEYAKNGCSLEHPGAAVILMW